MKPASIILDLLRTYPSRGTSVQKIMGTGAMFDFSENLMRVSLSRLAAKGTIENFRRGFYRLTDSTDPLNDFIEEWRLGDSKRRPWHNGWILVQSGTASWALKANGFRHIDTNLWARPDNLARSTSELQKLLTDLGAPEDCIIATNACLANKQAEHVVGQFDLAMLRARYLETIGKLSESLDRLEVIPTGAAQRECFHLGGSAIQVLALDPLLPDEILPGHERHKLWELMLVYDKVGREIWRGQNEDQPTTLPRAQVLTG